MTFLGYKYYDSTKEIYQKIYDNNGAILDGISREVNFLLIDIERLAVEIETNTQFTKIQNIPKEPRSGAENYEIALALRELKNINNYNYLIEDIILYYQKGNFFLNSLSIRTEEGIYQDYPSNSSVSYEDWKGALTQHYNQGQLLATGKSIFYVLTVPFNEEESTCNIIAKINTNGFQQLLNNYNVISGIDIFPTLCDYLELKPKHAPDGQSLLPLILGERANYFLNCTIWKKTEWNRKI